MNTSTLIALGAALMGYSRARAKRKKLMGAVLWGGLAMLAAPRIVQAANLPTRIALPQG